VIRVRRLKPEDAPAVRTLLAELGYPSSPRALARRIALLGGAARSALFLAVDGKTALGLLTLRWDAMIYRERPDARITALVVSSAARRRKVGQLLVERALAMARRAGCEGLEVTTGLQRRDAQQFYEALGFTRSSVRYYRKLRETPSSR